MAHDLYVTIMLDQLKQLFAISEEMVKHVRDLKHKRMETLLTDSE